jgi:hypothetical protein
MPVSSFERLIDKVRLSKELLTCKSVSADVDGDPFPPA